MRWDIIGIIGIVAAVGLALINWSREDQQRQKPPNAGVANWNAEKGAFDIPLNNNSSTVRRGYRATFRATQIREPEMGAPVEVDRIVFGQRDRIGEYTWQKSISDIKIPANDSSTINVYVVDPRLNGALLKGALTIEFAAEEKIQPVTYDGLLVTVAAQAKDLPR